MAGQADGKVISGFVRKALTSSNPVNHAHERSARW